jgi:hypothetical protein
MKKVKGIYSLKTHSKEEIEKKLDYIYSQIKPPIKLKGIGKINLHSAQVSEPLENTIELK